MADINHSSTPETKHSRSHSGARDHILAFIISLILSAIAFIVVIKLDTSNEFILPFIIFLAIVQALFQLGVWMHLNQKGHLFPIIGIASGSFVVLTAIYMALYWLW